MKKILVTIPVREKDRKFLEEKGKEFQFCYRTKEEITVSDVVDAEIILGSACGNTAGCHTIKGITEFFALFVDCVHTLFYFRVHSHKACVLLNSLKRVVK